VLGTQTGELILIDFLRMVEIRNLTANMRFLDRSESNQSPEEIEKSLKSVPVNTFISDGIPKSLE
jgi:hypothetical protein